MTADRELTEAKRDKLHDIVEVAGESSQQRDRTHEDTETSAFGEVTGVASMVILFGLAVAITSLGVDLIPDPFELILTVTSTAGWGGLVYACCFRSGRITGTALAFVLGLGFLGGVFSYFALDGPLDSHFMAIVFFTGTWILNGLGIVWIVQKVRRIRAASNTDRIDGAR